MCATPTGVATNRETLVVDARIENAHRQRCGQREQWIDLDARVAAAAFDVNRTERGTYQNLLDRSLPDVGRIREVAHRAIQQVVQQSWRNDIKGVRVRTNLRAIPVHIRVRSVNYLRFVESHIRFAGIV